MGKKDITLNEFLGDPYIFADLLNGCFFRGRQEILPEELLPMDSVQGTENRSGKPGKRIRDTKKLFYRHRPAAVLAIENQENPDCRMPVRCMRYDADEYERQIKAIAAVHKEKTGLAHFGEEDRLIPVFTIVLYYGAGGWKYPDRLHDLLEFGGAAQWLQKLAPDYPLRMLSVRKDLDIELFHTELREVMGILQRMDDKAAMRSFVNSNRDAFARMTERGFAVIVNCTNSRRLQKYIRENREGGCIDMCRAFDEWMDDCRKEGIKIGEERGEKRGERRGMKKGENRMAQLIQRLGEEERFTDILRVAEDASLRSRLYRKYGL